MQPDSDLGQFHPFRAWLLLPKLEWHSTYSVGRRLSVASNLSRIRQPNLGQAPVMIAPRLYNDAMAHQNG